MVSTLAFIPATPEEVAERLDTKMGLVRQTLMCKGEFLSDPAICGRVCWEQSSSGRKLVIKTEDSSPPDGADPPPSPTDAGSPSPSADDAVRYPTPPGSHPSPPAILTMVVQVVPGQSWLYPDGKWTGPTQFVRSFSDVKLLCTGSAPAHVRFHDDYATSVANLKSIMDEVRTAGNRTAGVLSVPDQYVKVRHNLFTEYENADDADPGDVAATRAWPTSTPEAAEALAMIAETHSVCPLPAYDQNGVAMEPRSYIRRLEGATVIMRFELHHYLIRNKKEKYSSPIDAFSARVVQLRVIIPPPTQSPVTPRRRKILPSDNYFGSFTPQKKPRKDDDDSDKENSEPPAKRSRVAA